MSDNPKNGKIGKGGKIALIVCIGVIIALLAVVIVLLVNKNSSSSIIGDDAVPTTTLPREVVVNNKNAEEIAEALVNAEPVPIGYYEVTMNSTWRFANGQATSENAYVENSTSNKNSVYFDVVRADTGENIYASPILPVGTYLDAIKLDTELPAGTYDCICTYTLLTDDNQPMSTLNISVTIIIQ